MPNPHPHNTARAANRFPDGTGPVPGRPGLYYVRYRDRDGARRKRYTREYDELLRLARELNGEHARANPRPAIDRRITVGGMLDRWLIDAGNRLRPKTVRGYREHVAGYIRPELGAIRLAELTRPDVDRMIAGLRGRGLSQSTILGAFNVLHVALNWAIDAELLERNPIGRMPKPRVEDVDIRPPSAAEVEAFLAAAAGHRLYALFVVAARTGLRQGEILGLRWADVVWPDTLEIRGTLDRDSRLRGPTKTAESSSSVAMIPAVANALHAHRAVQLGERMRAGRRWADPESVFTTPAGRALDGRAVTRELHRIHDAHGLRRFRFHDFRHHLATAMLGAGASTFDVMVALRHSRISTTVDQYGHRTPQQTARIRALIEGIAGA
jgi:integrase